MPSESVIKEAIFRQKERSRSRRAGDMLKLYGAAPEQSAAWQRVSALLGDQAASFETLPLGERFAKVLMALDRLSCDRAKVGRLCRYAALVGPFASGVGSTNQAERLVELWQRGCKGRLVARHLFGLVDRVDRRFGNEVINSIVGYLREEAGILGVSDLPLQPNEFMEHVQRLPEETRLKIAETTRWDAFVGALSLKLAEILSEELKRACSELKLERFDPIDFEQDAGIGGVKERLLHLKALAQVIEASALQKRLLALLQLKL